MIIIISVLNLANIFVGVKSNENFSIYDVSYKIMYCVKSLHIIFVKADGYIWKYGSTKYLALFNSDQKFEKIFGRIRYLFMVKIYTFILINKKKNKINSDVELPVEETINMQNVVISPKHIFNKYHNNCCQKFFRKTFI